MLEFRSRTKMFQSFGVESVKMMALSLDEINNTFYGRCGETSF